MFGWFKKKTPREKAARAMVNAIAEGNEGQANKALIDLIKHLEHHLEHIDPVEQKIEDFARSLND
jgi:hypothetical protein